MSIVSQLGNEKNLCKSSYEEVHSEKHFCANVQDKLDTGIHNPELPDHFKVLLERSSVHLEHQRQNLMLLLKMYEKIFVSSTDKLGCTERKGLNIK